MIRPKTLILLLSLNLLILSTTIYDYMKANVADAQTCVAVPIIPQSDPTDYYRHSGASSETGLPMQPTATHMCFLTGIRINDADSGGEWPGCEIYISSSIWYLRARHAGGDDDDASCNARCLKYN